MTPPDVRALYLAALAESLTSFESCDAAVAQEALDRAAAVPYDGDSDLHAFHEAAQAAYMPVLRALVEFLAMPCSGVAH
jgi:hypothetical protein